MDRQLFDEFIKLCKNGDLNSAKEFVIKNNTIDYKLSLYYIKEITSIDVQIFLLNMIFKTTNEALSFTISTDNFTCFNILINQVAEADLSSPFLFQAAICFPKDCEKYLKILIQKNLKIYKESIETACRVGNIVAFDMIREASPNLLNIYECLIIATEFTQYLLVEHILKQNIAQDALNRALFIACSGALLGNPKHNLTFYPNKIKYDSNKIKFDKSSTTYKILRDHKQKVKADLATRNFVQIKNNKILIIKLLFQHNASHKTDDFDEIALDNQAFINSVNQLYLENKIV